MAASATGLDDLQSAVLQRTLAQASAAESCCVICLDAISEPCEARPCGHQNYDFLCLLSWLEQQPRCPLCKSVVKEVAHGFQPTGSDAVKVKVYVVPSPKEAESAHPQPQPQRLRPNPLDRRRRQWVPQPRPTENEAILRRRDVYRNQLYSLHVGSNRRTARYRTHRDLSPQLFESDAELVSRARAWLRRELQVFEFLQTPAASTSQSSADAMTRRRANNAEFLLEYIIAILKTVDMQGSQGQAEEMLKDFLGRDNARLLLHELRSFLRTSVSIEAWDREVQYPRAPRRHRNSLDHVGGNLSSRRRPQTGSVSANGRPRLLPTYRPSGSSNTLVSEAVRLYNPD
ncbi:E3 ubiquitin-protein ligase Topors [Microdochium nivale]|nr:E3 ubiquitin-protein ligase Topors [Microdochium nivale]